MIRGKTHHCPFGLSIPGGCKAAGGSVSGSRSAAISKMQVIDIKDEDLEEVIDSNIEILLAVEEPDRCPFADMIIEKTKHLGIPYIIPFPEVKYINP